jgi:hypothetical protein
MWDGIVLYALAALLFLLVARQVEGRRPQQSEGIFSFSQQAWHLARREPVRAATVVLSLTIGFVGTLIVKGRPWSANQWDAFGLWITSWVAFLAAFVRVDNIRRGLRRGWETITRRKLEALLVTGLTVVAGLLRLIDLDGIPYLLTGDEAAMGLEAVRVLSGRLGNMFATGWASHPTFFFFLQAAFLRVFGINVTALRLLSALIGVATIPLFYLFTRLFYGRRISLIAATLLSFYHFHIHFSRLGLTNILDPLFALSVFYFFIKGLRSQRTTPFVISGMLLGFSQNFYAGSRLVPIILAAYVLFLMMQERGFWQRHSLHLIIFVLSLLVVGMPIASFFVRYPAGLMARVSLHGVFQSGWLERGLAYCGNKL